MLNVGSLLSISWMNNMLVTWRVNKRLWEVIVRAICVFMLVCTLSRQRVIGGLGGEMGGWKALKTWIDLKTHTHLDSFTTISIYASKFQEDVYWSRFLCYVFYFLKSYALQSLTCCTRKSVKIMIIFTETWFVNNHEYCVKNTWFKHVYPATQLTHPFFLKKNLVYAQSILKSWNN